MTQCSSLMNHGSCVVLPAASPFSAPQCDALIESASYALVSPHVVLYADINRGPLCDRS
jgi:hypothetical protein